MDILRIEIPFPPSINHYYLHTTHGVVLGAKGKCYRRDVCLLLNRYKGYCGSDRRLTVTINVLPPDKKKRDLDNILKATLDALQYAKIYGDDNQIDMLTVIRRDPVEHGALQIWIGECSSSE
jgi:crossover junction endodeoxyribonuclease RusA